MNTKNSLLQSEIRRLKKEKQAIIMAHYYQEPEIQDVADLVGDSLQMAQYAAQTQAEIIVVAGVYFMGETAKILNPTRKILLPDVSAGCSLADSCTAADIEQLRKEYPGSPVVTYINCSAAVKAVSDVVCTSSNAVNVINSLNTTYPIIFAPDINLGKYLIKVTGKKLILWNGSCLVHENFSIDKILKLHQKYPHAKFIAHPEAQPHILKVAAHIGSTKSLLDYIQQDDADQFIVATEAGILHQMKKAAPEKTIIAAPSFEDNRCACSECSYMKLNTLQKVYNCLLNETPTVEVEEDIRRKAANALNRMLSLS